MKNCHLKALSLNNYRNFTDLRLEFTNKPIIIIGENGSGKTNILESISLLSPGKGLRQAKFDDICNSYQNNWHSNFIMESKLGIAEITTNYTKAPRSRKIVYNSSKIASLELTKLVNIIWLTPQMDGIFLGSSSNRRKFLDRIVYNFENKHAKNVSNYEHYSRERLKMLQEDIMEPSWLGHLEEKMAMLAKEITFNRNKVIDFMQQAIDNLDSKFPKAELAVSKLITENIDFESDFIDYYKEKLQQGRQKDKLSNRTNFGVHRVDFLVYYPQRDNMLAKFCSTGEQKAMLISIIISEIEAIKQKAKLAPILLLDELFVHLDDVRKNYLIEFVLNSGLQSFITATDINDIKELSKHSQIVKLAAKIGVCEYG
ncbi:MAG: DNA replication/repair protein RecF [Rickettsiaceae bacterium]|nr:DNA replication/repair protein RecF [Rickettsiaceae bacterium]